jgi:hypothetical protein
MPQELRKKLQERFNRLKKSLKKALTTKKQNSYPQLVLQPYRARPYRNINN